jgi:hypothetical protein
MRSMTYGRIVMRSMTYRVVLAIASHVVDLVLEFSDGVSQHFQLLMDLSHGCFRRMRWVGRLMSPTEFLAKSIGFSPNLFSHFMHPGSR